MWNVLAIVLQLAFMVLLISAREKTTYTLYGSQLQLNWQDAYEFCKERGASLVSVTSRAENDILKSLAEQTHGKPWYNQLQDFWSGLHDPDGSTVADGYLWAEGSGACQPLSSWTNWYDNEPLNAHQSFCIFLERDGLRWRSTGCHDKRRVMCRSTGGSCSFGEAKDNRKIVSIPTVPVEATNEVECQEQCLAFSAFGLDCMAVEWRDGLFIDSCVLHMSNQPFEEKDLMVWPGTDVYLLTCYEAALDTTTQYTTGGSTYDPPCTEVIKGSDQAETTTVPAASGGEATRNVTSLVYAPVGVTMSTAESACARLSPPGTLVMPKDAAMTNATSLFLATTIGYTWVWLGLEFQTGLTWRDGQVASWPSKDTAPSSSFPCVMAAPQNRLDLLWKSTDCLSEVPTFLCQSTTNEECTFDTYPGKGVSSEWKLTSPLNAAQCMSHCNTQLYHGKECWAVTMDTLTDVCFLYYDECPLFLKNTSASVYNVSTMTLYVRSCFTFEIYDNSTEDINTVLYETSDGTNTSGQPTTANDELASSTSQTPTTAEYAATSTEHSTTASERETSTTNQLTVTAEQQTTKREDQSTTREQETTTDQQTTTTLANEGTTEDRVLTSEEQTTLFAASQTTGVKLTTELPLTSEGGTSAHAQTSTSWTPAVTVPSKDLHRQCACQCKPTTPDSNNTTNEAMVQKLLRELAIDAQQTSLNKRKSKSIPDNRVSATTIGCMGIGVLVTVIGVIVIMDMTNFLRRPASKSRRRNKNH